jgi:hypothetical protein
MHPFMNQSIPNIVDVPEEMRESALKRTADVLRKVDEVRRSLEMPVEQLPIVIETYGKVVMSMLAEKQREELAARTSRMPLTMMSETRDYQPMKIARGKQVSVIARPQTCVFRPEDIAIHGDRSRWVVHDIMVGNRSQLAQKRGPAPGSEFGPGGILEHMRLESVKTAMDFTLIVEYVGPEAEGEVFEATVVGTAVDL